MSSQLNRWIVRGVFILAGFLAMVPPCIAAGNDPADKRPARTDLNGDALPAGALVRLGSVRFHHPGGMIAMDFSPDGKTVLAAGFMEGGLSLRFWETATGKEQSRIDVKDYNLRCAFFSPDGNAVAIGRGETIELFDRQSGKLLRKIEGKTHNNAFTFSPDGKLLAAGGTAAEGTGNDRIHPIKVWEVATGKELPQFAGSRGWNLCELKFSADGKLLLSAFAAEDERHDDKTIKVPGAICVWDVSSRKKLHEIVNQNTHVVAAADCQAVAMGSGTMSPIRVMNVVTGKELGRVTAENASFVLAPDGKTLLTVREGQEPCLWDVASGKELRRFKGRPAKASRLGGFSRDGKFLAMLSGGWSNDGHVCLWDVATGEPIRQGVGHVDEVNHLAYSPDGKLLASASRDWTVRLWDPATGQQLKLLTGHPGAVHAVAFAPDGKTLASACDADIRLWELAGGREIAKFEAPGNHEADWWHSVPRVHLAFAPDGKTLVATRSVGEIAVLDLAARKKVNRFKVDGKASSILGISCDAGAVLCATRSWWGDDDAKPETMSLVNSADGKPVKAIALRSARKGYDSIDCWAAAFSSDSRLMATSQSLVTHGLRTMVSDHKVRIWDLDLGQEAVTLKDSSTMAQALAFSANARLLAVGYGGSYMKTSWLYSGVGVWDALTGEPVGILPGHAAHVRCVAFAPNGKSLASGSADHTVLIWSTPSLKAAKSPEPSPAKLQNWWRDLATGDAAIAHQTLANFVGNPDAALKLFRTHLSPASSPDVKRVEVLIADLNSSKFQPRQKAHQELEEMRDLAVPALRKALESEKSLEVRARLELLLEKADTFSPNQMRSRRVILVLERIGSPEARQFLESLSHGAPEARVTQEALTALRRLPPPE